MIKAVLLILPTTLILSSNYGTLAQVVTSTAPELVLVKGDTPSSPTPSCSFISATVLSSVPIVQGLLFVRQGDSPDLAESKIPFTPDRPYANGVLQWTAMREENYVRAVVTFRNNGALTRSFTMATNYKQPDEKQCQWEVREEQQGTQQGTQQNPQSNP